MSMPGAGLSLALTLVLSAGPTPDPRIPLADLQVGREVDDALLAVERALVERPELVRGLGYDHLRAELLLMRERRDEALEALAASMTAAPGIGVYSRYRLAEEQAALGRHGVAAGLLATLLADGPPPALAEPAMRLFQRTLNAGGDCRLLRGLSPSRFRGKDQRRLRLAEARCDFRAGDRDSVETALRALLESDVGDDAAYEAAQLLVELEPEDRSGRSHMLIGQAFHAHRDFGRAIQHLARAIARQPGARDVSRSEIFETRYSLARSHFWEGRYAVAAAAFRALARDAASPDLRSKVLYQQGRCLELDDDWEAALSAYREAYAAAPSGGWVDSSLMSQLRLSWRSGRESAALDVYRELVRRRRTGAQARALLFMSASDLVQGRMDRAGEWLTTAARTGQVARTEVAYWSGRRAELAGEDDAAVEYYLEALFEDPYDPFAVAARKRLNGPALAGLANARGRRLAGSRRTEDLYKAYLLRGNDDVGRGARQILQTLLSQDAAVGPFLQLAAAPPNRWPLWGSPLRQPEEMLLALGLWQQGASVVLRHFPIAEPDLAYTGSLLLAQAGETKRSLYIAEVLRKRIPRRVPTALLPTGYQRLLYPFRYGYTILRESERRGSDPYLLAAIIREESRFDPVAFSGAAARGLAQFVLPTALRLAPDVGLDGLVPQDLERPEVSIALGAAYLRELDLHFEGDRVQMIAAYNAGESQAALWRRYCFTDEAPELLSKITFRETRNYVRKVLTSYAHYHELYAEDAALPSSLPSP